MLMLGAINWVTAPCTTKVWIFILCEVGSVFAFLMAYICYRKARKIAETLDKPKVLEITITKMFPDEIMQSDAKESEEYHEDIGAPV